MDKITEWILYLIVSKELKFCELKDTEVYVGYTTTQNFDVIEGNPKTPKENYSIKLFEDPEGKIELENIAGLEIAVNGHDKQIVIDASNAEFKEKTKIYAQVCALQPDPSNVQSLVDKMVLHRPELMGTITKCIDDSGVISQETLDALQAFIDAILNGKV